jgi:hypothetical protein
MTPLIDRPVKRLFTFGCSFTEYFWSAWPEIIALDLDVPLYNFGRSGAGNQYISNMIAHADSIYNFTENDLVIVSWTNVCREDRWVNGRWITPGNIFTQGEYDENFIKKWGDPVGYLMRDLSLIKLTGAFLKLKKCQYHFFSMVDIVTQIDQNNHETCDPKFNPVIEKLAVNYKNDLAEIQKSFFATLWNNNIYNNKILPDVNVYGKYWSDGHPSPSEHLKYLKLTFDHKFKDATESAVANAQQNLETFVKNVSDQKKKTFAIYELDANLIKNLKEKTKIKSSEFVQIL